MDWKLNYGLAAILAAIAALFYRGVLKLEGTAARLDAIAGEFDTDEQGIATLLTQNKTTIDSLRTQGVDPAALDKLDAIHQRFAALLATPPPADSGTTTPA